jgi:hypothetical protein
MRTGPASDWLNTPTTSSSYRHAAPWLPELPMLVQPECQEDVYCLVLDDNVIVHVNCVTCRCEVHTFDCTFDGTSQDPSRHFYHKVSASMDTLFLLCCIYQALKCLKTRSP